MILNSIIYGFRGPGLELLDNETFANCPGTQPAVFHTPTITAVEEDQTTLNSGRLYTIASPNPTSGGTNLMFSLPHDRKDVRAQIFDVSGRLVETLAAGPMSRGPHNLRWTPKRLATGSYFFRITTEDGQAVNTKLVLVR
jgi:flagellar hook assembly protein FlgD